MQLSAHFLVIFVDMGHHHQHTPNNYNIAFAVGIGLNLAFVAVEIIFGLLANSSALLADAGHNASDVLGLAFAWAAAWLSSKKPKGKYTYGYKRTTILVSILNAILLFAAVIAIGWDAFGKFSNPEPVAGQQIIIVAGIGVLINTFTALLFIKGQKEDLNIKGAFLHMAADAIVSLGVVIVGILINITGYYLIDPIMSYIIILVILWGTWRLFLDSIRLALDAVPRNIDITEVEESILSLSGVSGIHDLHVWAMSTNENSLSVHVNSKERQQSTLLNEINQLLIDKFHIYHTTIQIEQESEDHNCSICS